MTLAIDTETFLDLDNHKGLVGIEILNPKRTWPIEAISQYLTSKQEGTLLAWNELAMEGGL